MKQVPVLRNLRLSNIEKKTLLYLFLEKGVTLHLNKLEFPLPTEALCQVWLKLDMWFPRR